MSPPPSSDQTLIGSPADTHLSTPRLSSSGDSSNTDSPVTHPGASTSNTGQTLEQTSLNALSILISALHTTTTATPLGSGPGDTSAGGSRESGQDAATASLSQELGSSTGAAAIPDSGTTIVGSASASQSVATSALTETAPTSAQAAPAVVIGDSTVTPDSSSRYMVQDQTLAVESTSTISSGASSVAVAMTTNIGGATVLQVNSGLSLLSGPSTTPHSTALASIVVAEDTITANSRSQYIVSGSTLALGSSIIVSSGTSAVVVALRTSESQTLLVIGTSTSTINSSSTALPPPLTIGTAVVSANNATEYILGSQTLAPGGPPVTFLGTQISLASGATQVVLGTATTEALTSEASLGGYIWSGLVGGSKETADGSSGMEHIASTAGTTGGGGQSTATRVPAAYTGASTRCTTEGSRMMVAFMLSVTISLLVYS